MTDYNDDPNTLQQGAAMGLAREDAPSLSDLATPEDKAGAWEEGWYHATVLDGYSTGRGKVMQTSDLPSKEGTSRNLYICVAVSGDVFVPSDDNPKNRILKKGPGGTRNIRVTFNYRPDDFTAARIEEIKAGRVRYKNAPDNKWPDKALQTSSLSLGRLGQLEKAVGFKLPFANGRLNPQPFVGQALDARLTITVESEKQRGGFSEVAAVAPSGSHVK